MAKIWHIKTGVSEDNLKDLTSYPKLLRQLLFNRGLNTKEAIEEFLNPEYSKLHDPFLFRDMQKAVDRIWLAISNREKVAIYGDYDADAVTANAVLQQTFNYLGFPVESYIPDRFTEGYGINLEALQKIKDRGSKIIITVDCGTNSRDAADWCLKNGLDFIITDHHEIIGDLPKAFALINPKNPADNYPYHEITGVGVAFKLAAAMLKDKRFQNHVPNYQEGWEKWLLDLVAIGTVADCHSLLGENRILVKYGLKVLAKTKWLGLRALIEAAKLDFSKTAPDTYTLGFVIAPRLNAAGRLTHADAALDLLVCSDAKKAEVLAAELEQINTQRQEQTKRILSEAREQAVLIESRKFIVVYGEGWNKGVVGLVAGRLAEEFYKPVVVLEKGESESTGSARTAGDFDLLESLKHASEHIHRFGGHRQAAGLTVKNEKLEIFYEKVLEFAEKNITEADLVRKLSLEAELGSEDLSLSTHDLISRLEPFGIDNLRPKFVVKNLTVSSIRLVGKDGNHLQIRLKNKTGREVDSIYFSASVFAKNLKIGDNIDVACELMQDTWNNSKYLKLRVVDLKQTNHEFNS